MGKISQRSKFYLNEHFASGRSTSFTMTKVVSTIGPKSDNQEVMQQLVDAGLRIMRINFSHATYDEASARVDRLRNSRGVHSARGQSFNLRATLLDTQGPEIRTGKLKGGEVALKQGQSLELSCDPACGSKLDGDAARIFVNYDGLSRVMSEGDTVLLDDGLIGLTVTEVVGTTVRCVVNNNGKLGNTKGVNLPGVITDLPALTDKDRQDLRWGVENDVDFVAASFIRKAADVREMRLYLQQEYARLHGPDCNRPIPKIISKIENDEGVRNFDEILAESDGIMVARGDLGVEIPLQEVFLAQKRMVNACNEAGKPVIVATQMLESMIQNPRPTRAEVSDVGNAVLDGADCVMLSGETAKGKYPVESVQTMVSILNEADHEYDLSPRYLPRHVEGMMGFDKLRPGSRRKHVMAVANAAVAAGNKLKAALIIVITKNGNTARLVARHRPQVPVMTFCSSTKVARQLQIHRGIFPVATEGEGEEVTLTQAEAIRSAKALGWVSEGDTVVVLSSNPESQLLGEQTLMRVATVV